MRHGPVTTDEVLDLLSRRITTVLGTDKPVNADTRFGEDLHADSLDLVEVLEGLEDQLAARGIRARLEDTEVVALRTVGEAAARIAARARLDRDPTTSASSSPRDGPQDLQAALGVAFDDPVLLELALTHRSHAFEAGGLPTNERLEFLGDAVLGLVITDWIYRRFPDESEGRLAKLRAATVNARSLADVARELDLGAKIRVGRGEDQSGGRDKDSILADTLEAVLGAVYLDQGMTVAQQVVTDLFAGLLEDLAARKESLDYKTSLQELTAARLQTLPAYSVSDEGPDHDKLFTATVTVHGERFGEGTGRSKKAAEQAAAEVAYLVLVARLGGSEPAGETAHQWDGAVGSEAARQGEFDVEDGGGGDPSP